MSYNAERYKSDPEYRARIVAGRRKYYNKIKDTPEFKEGRRKYYNKIKDTPEFKAKNVAASRKWYEANPDKVKQYRSTDKYKEHRRERQRAAYQAMSEDQRAALLERRREYNKQYDQKRKRYLADPDYAASLTPIERERIQRSIDRARESSREYYSNHKSECYARYREWVAKNLERRRELARQYSHRCKERKAPIAVM